MMESSRYDSLFQFYGEAYRVDWRLLRAQALVESAMNPLAVSQVGARGLAQFMSRTFEEWRDGTPGVQESPPENLAYLQPENPEACIRAQAAYMAWLLKHCGDDIEKALAAYNWGIARVLRLGDGWRGHLPDETRQYVAKVIAAVTEGA